jgi:hypothetical protein
MRAHHRRTLVARLRFQAIVGHADEGVLDAIKETMDKGTSFGAPCALENELAKMVIDAVPSVEMVRTTPRHRHNSTPRHDHHARRRRTALAGAAHIARASGGAVPPLFFFSARVTTAGLTIARCSRSLRHRCASPTRARRRAWACCA